ncbi:hypothetical protein V6N13_036504 [Hibiscus sabdariffa]
MVISLQFGLQSSKIIKGSLITCGCCVPNLLKFSGKGLLSANNNCDVVFIFNNLKPSTRDFSLDIVAALEWDYFVLFAVNNGDIAIQSVVDDIQVPVELGGGATNNVVKCMPGSVMCVAEEPFHQYHLVKVNTPEY